MVMKGFFPRVGNKRALGTPAIKRFGRKAGKPDSARNQTNPILHGSSRGTPAKMETRGKQSAPRLGPAVPARAAAGELEGEEGGRGG